MALSLSTFLAFESTCVSASSRCSVETNSSFIVVGFASGPLRAPCDSAVAELRRRAAARLWADAPARPRRSARAAPRLAPILSSIGRTMPSLLGQQRGQQVQRLDLRIAALGRQLLRARCTASWALIVSLSNRKAMDESVQLISDQLVNANSRDGCRRWLIADSRQLDGFALLLHLELGVDRFVVAGPVVRRRPRRRRRRAGLRAGAGCRASYSASLIACEACFELADRRS